MHLNRSNSKSENIEAVHSKGKSISLQQKLQFPTHGHSLSVNNQIEEAASTLTN